MKILPHIPKIGNRLLHCLEKESPLCISKLNLIPFLNYIRTEFPFSAVHEGLNGMDSI